MCAVSGVLYDVTHIHTDTQRPEEKNRKLVLVWSRWGNKYIGRGSKSRMVGEYMCSSSVDSLDTP